MLLSLGGYSHGIAKTHLQHLLTAAAANVVRVGLWLDDTPRAKTDYPTNVRAMSREDVGALSTRGEQLVRALLPYYCPSLC